MRLYVAIALLLALATQAQAQTVRTTKTCALWKTTYLEKINVILGAGSSAALATLNPADTAELNVFMAHYVWFKDNPDYNGIHMGDCVELVKAVWSRLGYTTTWDPSSKGTMPLPEHYIPVVKTVVAAASCSAATRSLVAVLSAGSLLVAAR